MIELTQTDEYGAHYCTETFLTVDDARDALNQMECALEDAISATQSYRLQDLINQLKEQIEQHES
jgi:hypothetical protein